MHNAEPIAHVVFSPDGKLLACGGIGGTSEVFAVADGKELYEVRVRTPAFTKDGKAVVGISKVGSLLEYDSATGKQKKELKGTTPNSSLLSADSKQLFAYSGSGKDVIVIDAATGASTGAFSGATMGILDRAERRRRAVRRRVRGQGGGILRRADPARCCEGFRSRRSASSRCLPASRCSRSVTAWCSSCSRSPLRPPRSSSAHFGRTNSSSVNSFR